MTLSRRAALTRMLLGGAAARLGLSSRGAQAGEAFTVTHTEAEWRKLLARRPIRHPAARSHRTPVHQPSPAREPDRDLRLCRM